MHNSVSRLSLLLGHALVALVSLAMSFLEIQMGALELSPPMQLKIRNNRIGTNADGDGPIPNDGHGLWVLNSKNSVIHSGNIISGNALNGVTIEDSQNNTLQGNFIGLNAAGDAPIANGQNGVFVGGAGDVSGNLIGGTSVGARNVISGNTVHGIVYNTNDGLRIEGNYIGTDALGGFSIGNADGIAVFGPGVDDWWNHRRCWKLD